MKSRCLVVSCLIALFPTHSVRAELRFTRSSVDLGEIRGGQPLTQNFVFENDSREDIEITEVRPGCGCLSPRISKTRIAPRESGALEIDLRTLGQAAGPHTWTARVRYRCGEKTGEVPLTISANIINDILLQPASLSLLAHGPMTQEVIVIDTRAYPLRVTDVHTSSSFLKARILGQEKNAAGLWQARIALDLGGDCPPGRHSETLAIYTTDPAYRQFVVPVSISMSSPATLSAQPSILELTAPEVGVLSKFIRINSSLPGPVFIESVTADHPALTCTWARGPQNAATLRIRVDAERLHGRREATLRVQVSNPQKASLNVPVRFRHD